MVEHLLCKQGVGGSSPLVSTDEVPGRRSDVSIHHSPSCPVALVVYPVMIVNEPASREKIALLVRINTDLHRRAKKAARDQETSLARLVERALARELHYEPPGKIVARAIRNTTAGGRRGFNSP